MKAKVPKPLSGLQLNFVSTLDMQKFPYTLSKKNRDIERLFITDLK